MTSRIGLKPSRFALLKVEDDDDDEQENDDNLSTTKQQPSKSQQKKAKKKKSKTSQQDAELKNLAFGKSGGRQRTQSGDVEQNGDHHKPPGSASDKQWEEWQKLDAEYTADTFEKDLQQALLLSKVEFEHDKQARKVQTEVLSISDQSRGGGDGQEKKKKKKKDKPNPMTLEEFNQLDEDNKPKTIGDELEDVPSGVALAPVAHSRLTPTEEDKKFFDKVEDDVHRILRQEKMHEEYKKQYAVENVLTAKFQDELNKKNKELEFLRATMKKQEEELKQVKKRNKQLCVILAQGEMKDKAEVLMQVDQLSQVKDELTEQVTELTGELEKERSKVHALKSELDKLKSGKHATR